MKSVKPVQLDPYGSPSRGRVVFARLFQSSLYSMGESISIPSMCVIVVLRSPLVVSTVCWFGNVLEVGIKRSRILHRCTRRTVIASHKNSEYYAFPPVVRLIVDLLCVGHNVKGLSVIHGESKHDACIFN